MATKTWTGDFDDWTTATDWSPAGVPGSADDVVVGQGDAIINTDVGNVSSVKLTGLGSVLDDGNLGATTVVNDGLTFDVSFGATLTANLIVNEGNASDNSTGRFNVTAGTVVTSDLNNSRTFSTNSGVVNTNSLENSGQMYLSDGGKFVVNGKLTNTGGITVDPASGSSEQITVGSLENAGEIDVRDGGFGQSASLVIAGATTGTGSIHLTTETPSSTTRLTIEFKGAASNDIVLLDASQTYGSATIQFDAPAAGYTGKITGFSQGDILDVKEQIASYSYDGVKLTITPASGGPNQAFALSGSVSSLSVSPDGSGGTQFGVVCFAAGTHISTPAGNVRVERLAVGDLVLTASDRHRAIRWLGHRIIKQPSFEQRPVLIRAGAFGSGLPRNDLFLSPGHPVLVGADVDGSGGYLVPIMCLINGTTIDRVPVESVTYWHVELDQHDILFAEGLPAESYLDWGDRAFFSEASAHALTNPDFVVPGLGGRCRPVSLDGLVVEVERRRLDAVFAAGIRAQCAWPTADAAFGL